LGIYRTIHPIRLGSHLMAACLAAGSSAAAELKKETIDAFGGYLRAVEARVAEHTRPGGAFLWSGLSPDRLARVRGGDIAVEASRGKAEREIPGGLIHDWIGGAFIPGATLEATLAFVKNYDNHKNVYKPEVIESRILYHNGDHYKIHLRLMKKKVITAVLNTEHEVRYFPLDARRCHSRSYTTRIAEVEDAGEPGEREMPVGDDHGFLWRLYSYWRFEERDGGVYIECEAISLTRKVPTGLGWLITPIIRELPKESLANTLRQTRDALAR